jgi:membrane-associated phospholipid phosphatase
MPSSKEIKYYLLFLALILPFFYFDQYIMVWIRELRSANPDIDQILHYVGRAAYYAAHGTPLITGAALLYLAGVYFKKQGIRHIGKTLLIGFISAGIFVQIIKHLLGRARPRLTDNLVFIGPTLTGSYDSFPSGHTMSAFCLAYICSRYFPKYQALFYVYGIFICIGRVVSGSHFPADALGGALLGVVIGRIVYEKTALPGALKRADQIDK